MSLLDPPLECTSGPASGSDVSAMGSRPRASHSVTRRLLDKGSRLFGCSSLPFPASSSAASLPSTSRWDGTHRTCSCSPPHPSQQVNLLP